MACCATGIVRVRDPGLVVGVDLIGVEALAEEQLTRERAVGALRDHLLVAFLAVAVPLGGDGQHVALDGEIDGTRIDPGKVEVDDELVAAPERVERELREAGLVSCSSDRSSSRNGSKRSKRMSIALPPPSAHGGQRRERRRADERPHRRGLRVPAR